ncbi:hypothetical protein NEUTE1DRAFT_112290 [Neurospora tetrasperma FGSC 2508]|uniref:Uncharacterized protein n=1 Tax=Neurospora tetrasperma (strain FGSC 2508 / ATCC MYA-4615 / P0657) TaxID=510951 RepID=F8MRV7_NEUT8|nr:uncharacterized protein NEUTE1DRAFT_112290 [Neurospora tetrasperma FGSC 2508]EGO55803.1 hypothetical protein NEUTE1DRAFT_112290 [Neurospora tetrasperma FGSC 2508]
MAQPVCFSVSGVSSVHLSTLAICHVLMLSDPDLAGTGRGLEGKERGRARADHPFAYMVEIGIATVSQGQHMLASVLPNAINKGPRTATNNGDIDVVEGNHIARDQYLSVLK